MKNRIKRYVSSLLICLFVFFQAFPAFAEDSEIEKTDSSFFRSVLQDSLVQGGLDESEPDELELLELEEADETEIYDDRSEVATLSESLYQSSSGSLFSVRPDETFLSADIYENGKWKRSFTGIRFPMYDTDTEFCYRFPPLSGDEYYANVYWTIKGTRLPPPGRYQFSWTLSSINPVYSFKSASVLVFNSVPNVDGTVVDYNASFSSSSPHSCVGEAVINSNTYSVGLYCNVSKSDGLGDFLVLVPSSVAYNISSSSSTEELPLSFYMTNISVSLGSILDKLDDIETRIVDGFDSLEQKLDEHHAALLLALSGISGGGSGSSPPVDLSPVLLEMKKNQEELLQAMKDNLDTLVLENKTNTESMVSAVNAAADSIIANDNANLEKVFPLMEDLKQLLTVTCFFLALVVGVLISGQFSAFFRRI